MDNIRQHHSGSGDNVRDKFVYHIKAITPADLAVPIEILLESIRQGDLITAKGHIRMLRAVVANDRQSSALVEAVSIYGNLLEPDEQLSAWGTVSNIAATAENELIKDVCLAAILRLSSSGDRRDAAHKHFLQASAPGPLATEEYLRHYAEEAVLKEIEHSLAPSESRLTGAVEGALRLGLSDLAQRMSASLQENFRSQNSLVIGLLVAANRLQDQLGTQHLFLAKACVKKQLDELTAQLVMFLDGPITDARVLKTAGVAFARYCGNEPKALRQSLIKHVMGLALLLPDIAAVVKALAGDKSALPQRKIDFIDALERSELREEWCSRYLLSESHTIEDAVQFTALATPVELKNWLSAELTIEGASDLELHFVRLLAKAAQCATRHDEPIELHVLGQAVDDFQAKWSQKLKCIAPELIFEAAEYLFVANLPQKAIDLCASLVPSYELWPSPFVLTYAKCLIKADKLLSFDELVARIAGASESLTIMNLESIKAEGLGDIPGAIRVSDQMIARGPAAPFSWYRACALRDRYASADERNRFFEAIPDDVLDLYSPEIGAVMFIITRHGFFKRAEPRWIRWFLTNPRELATDLTDFHFGLLFQGKVEVTPSLTSEECLAAVEYEQEGTPFTKFVVLNCKRANDLEVEASSPLGSMLLSLEQNERASIGIVEYELKARLPPYVACVRNALLLRQHANDGNDPFGMLKLPPETKDLGPYLEARLVANARPTQRLTDATGIPIYVLGHALSPNDPIKAALCCWSDAGVAKSPLWASGDANANVLVLDAYGATFLSITDLVKPMLDLGIRFALPPILKSLLTNWVSTVSNENFLQIGLTKTGKLFGTTAEDIRLYNGHTITAMRLILEHSEVIHPRLHDTSSAIYSIKFGVDDSVYSAMQLSLANGIPWFCVDSMFASLHTSYGGATVNVLALVQKAKGSTVCNFKHRRHGLLLFAVSSFAFPIFFDDCRMLASHRNELAGLILVNILRNRGTEIFGNGANRQFLLDLIYLHVKSRVVSEKSHWASMLTSWAHVEAIFNFALKLFLEANDENSVEHRVALAMLYLATFLPDRAIVDALIVCFDRFVDGHLLDNDLIREEFAILSQVG